MHNPTANSFSFHPLEISFCGLSGSGKTTLIEALASRWSQQQKRFVYIKHDAHSFTMDASGKDTYRLTTAGAAAVYINDASKQAFLRSGSSLPSWSTHLLEYEFALIEGYKALSIPKVVVLDERCEILSLVKDDDYSLHRAYIGPWPSLPAELSQKLQAPYFCRNDIASISLHIETYFHQKISQRPLNGLILAGGRSTRMGQDKALISYIPGRNQLQHCYALLAPLCHQVYVSVRENENENRLGDLPPLHDTFLNMGPLGGILSAFRYNPSAAWLVLAIDLPALRPATLATLIHHRNPFACATAFRSRNADCPEPLCAIYEPHCYPIFLSMFGKGFTCPTGILKQVPVKLLYQAEDALDLENINTPHDYQRLLNDMKGANVDKSMGSVV